VRGRTALQIRRYGRSFAILLALMVLGTAAGFYILLQQRLPNPFQTFYAVDAAFSSAAAVVPGLGEPVNVAGVHVGEITGTDLRNGLGVIHMEIDPHKMPRLYQGAHADLVANTPLKDMEVNIFPGDPKRGVLARGATIPVGQTTTPVDADELLSGLDGDTRSWFTSLITELDNGTRGRGTDIRALLQNLGPTAADSRQIGDLLAGRRQELSQLVHNLGILGRATAARDGQLQTVVQAGRQTLDALAGQDVALQQSLQRLPPTLSTARRTLGDLATLSNVLAPTATALLPTARNLPTLLRQSNTLFSGAALLPLDQIKPFINSVTPLAGRLPGLEHTLSQVTPQLIRSFKVLAYVTNEFAYNPGHGNPGFMYWFAWFAHNTDSFMSSSDANGPVWRALLLSSCASLKSFAVGPLLETVLGTKFGCAG
jgi:phospholipid/cholesterol/gamma-HCH transport system substrate-binding protein